MTLGKKQSSPYLTVSLTLAPRTRFHHSLLEWIKSISEILENWFFSKSLSKVVVLSSREKGERYCIHFLLTFGLWNKISCTAEGQCTFKTFFSDRMTVKQSFMFRTWTSTSQNGNSHLHAWTSSLHSNTSTGPQIPHPSFSSGHFYLREYDNRFYWLNLQGTK